jgi:uncharacterized delta-60 repeat protein
VKRGLVAIASLGVSLAMACAASGAGAAPADLDSSFGGDGIVELEPPMGSTFQREAGARMAIGPEDGVFVLYSNYPPCEPPFECPVALGIARYDANGLRDASYGTGPGSLLQVREFTERKAFDLGVGPDGRAAVAAYDQDEGGVIVARFDAGGRLDGNFGNAGRAPQPLDTLRDTPVAVAVQADGKIVVAGEGGDNEGPHLIVQRYLTDGQLDPGFGTGGAVTIPLTTKSRPADLLLDPTGRITIVAPICCKGSSGAPVPTEGVSVVRLLPDGRPDGGLGGTGSLLVPTPGALGEARAAALAPDGGLFLGVEEAAPPLDSRSFTVDNVFKLRPDGAPDTSFGEVGRLRLFDRVGSVDVNGMAADREGRLVAVGGGEKGYGAVARLRVDGSVDRTFNGGVVANPVGGARPIAVALQSSGRIVVLTSGGPAAFAVAGLKGGTSRVRCLGKRATIVGTARPDEIVGTPRRDVIAALAGRDKVRALSGADLICGGKGRDAISGGPGRDTVLHDPVRRRRHPGVR